MAKGKRKWLVACVSVLIFIVIAAVLIFVQRADDNDEVRTYPQSEIVSSNVNTGVTVIDDTAAYQTMNGFGASACWWSQYVGDWENRDEILSYLYDSEKGIGLNIYRYNLGAGSLNDERILTQSRRTQCFINSDGEYDFTADAAAQKCLAAARKLAGDNMRVELFCNSAPVSLTKNGKAYGAPITDWNAPLRTNLDEDNYKAFADYCYNCSDYFLGEGYRVVGLSPINEPQYDWRASFGSGDYTARQEGCHYSDYEATELFKVMVNRFSGTDVDAKGCKIKMFESGESQGEGSIAQGYIDNVLSSEKDYKKNNKVLREYFDTICTHSYWSSAQTKQEMADYLARNYSTYDVACTEYCQMTGDENTGVYELIQAEQNGTKGLGIEYGVAMANVIMDDLTILNAKEWSWWTACSDGVYTDGLIYLNQDNHSQLELSKRLWCLGNYSRFIREGAVRVACSSGLDSVRACAFVNEDNSTVIVYVNNTDKDESTALTVDNSYAVYTTSDKSNLENTANGKAGDTQISIPAMSVVTVVIK